MPKRKERSPDEFLKGKVRELEKENRQLKKRVRQLEKTEHMFENHILDEEPLIIEEKRAERICPDCGKGKLKEFSLLDRVFEECEICSYRKKIHG